MQVYVRDGLKIYVDGQWLWGPRTRIDGRRAYGYSISLVDREGESSLLETGMTFEMANLKDLINKTREIVKSNPDKKVRLDLCTVKSVRK